MVMAMSNEVILLNKILDASANTIWDELKKIRESSDLEKKIIRRRWIWELIQNASDCTPKGGKIDIKIEYNNKKIEFSHNGVPFSYENLLDLITQISSKQSSEDKKIGKFGTGFMSTHLLSEIVQIESSFIAHCGKYKKLRFTIDRSGVEYKDIRKKTELMLQQLKFISTNSDELKEKYEETKFIYLIDDHVVEAVREGISDLEETIPYILSFNNHINSISYNGKYYEKEKEITSSKNSKIKFICISAHDSKKKLLVLNENGIIIGCPIERYDDRISFLEIPDTLPKIFCNFPLVGTEGFSFPIIINSNLFEVERDRNAIRENNEENKILIKTAVSLYKELISYCSLNMMTKDIFNICILNLPITTSSIQNNCYNTIKECVEYSKIVKGFNCEREEEILTYRSSPDSIQIGIPKTKNKELLDSFWEVLFYYKNILIPSKDTYLGWSKVFGGNLNFSWINDMFEKQNDMFEKQNVDNFSDNLYNKTVLINWLNKFYSLWIEDIGVEEVTKIAFVPNQNNKFVKFDKVYSDENIDEELKEILTLLGVDIKSQLLNKDIFSFNNFFEKNMHKIKTNNNCSERIDSEVSKLLGKETIDREERDEPTQKIFNKITNWFLSNPEDSINLFKNLYPKRMMLSSPKENLRRYKIAEKIEENNIKYEDLDGIIANRDKVIEIISNSELSKEEIISQLKYIVNSSVEMKEYVDNLISRSIKNVYEYLKNHKDYILPSTLEEWKKNSFSETVFSAKYKKQEIRIVIRPSDLQKIIFYYEEELEALDDYEYQLWTDNGEKQSMITLGDLLKTTGISKIPLKKI